MKFRHQFKLASFNENTRIYACDNIIMRLDFIEDILRISLIKNEDMLPTFSINPKHEYFDNKGRDKLSLDGFKLISPKVIEDKDYLSFKYSNYDIKIDLLNFRMTISNDKGILYQDRNGLAYNFDGELGEGSIHYTKRYEDQYIYGLGDKSGNVNKNHKHYKLDTNDAMGYKAEYSDPLYKYLPFYICENEIGTYGIYYDTYSEGEIDFGKEHDNYYDLFNSIKYEEENMIFYIIFGNTKEIINKFIDMTGGLSNIPSFAYKYCGSSMEYTDSLEADKNLRSFIDNCHKYDIEAGGFYLSSGYTQIGDKRYVFHWNKDKIPSPLDLSNHFRNNGLEIIPNIKPAFLDDHPMYEMIAKNNWFLHYKDGSPAKFPFWGGNASYLDFTNPDAYNFWKKCVKETLVDEGYQNIWNDNNEYDIHDKDVYAYGFNHEVPAKLIKPLFSYLMSKASREVCLEVNKNPFNVSRCAVAGSQIISSTWTGDNYTSFKDLRYNHFQIMTMSLSGFSFFGPDIGGFSGPKPSKELFIRWLQYGVFLPRFVLHSRKINEDSTMPWLYEDKMEIVKKIFDLREELIPYLIKEHDKCIKNNMPLVTPIFLKDHNYDRESDYFMCGEKILVCPIFDEGKNELDILLPDTSTFYKLRGEGEKIKGGSNIKVRCSIDDLPIWFVEEE